MLLRHFGFNSITGFVLDPMHNVFIGMSLRYVEKKKAFFIFYFVLFWTTDQSFSPFIRCCQKTYIFVVE